jgi:hypothetical protein
MPVDDKLAVAGEMKECPGWVLSERAEFPIA